MNFLTTTTGQVLLGLFILVNVIAFLDMVLDKRRAARGRYKERASEGVLFFLATMFGSVGVWLGMYVCRHKTRKWYFQIGIPVLVLQNIATMYVLWQLFSAAAF